MHAMAPRAGNCRHKRNRVGPVQVRGGFWCFESEAEATGYEAGFHEPFVGREPGKPKRLRKR